jgi:hypothetical protein
VHEVAVTRYLLTGIAPPSGAVCEQDIVPFTLPLPSTTSSIATEAHRAVRGSLIPEVIMRATP